MKRVPLLVLPALPIAVLALGLSVGCTARVDTSPTSTASTALTTSTVATTATDSTTYKYVHSEIAMSPESYPKTLEDLEAGSLAIALVTAREPQQNPESVQSGQPMGNTITQVIVEKAFKSDGKIAAGSDTRIIEYYITAPSTKDPGITYVYGLGNMRPMRPGETYLLFLTRASHSYGDYEILGIWHGKFVVSEDVKAAADVGTLTADQLEIGASKDEDPRYWSLAQDVRDKYVAGALVNR